MSNFLKNKIKKLFSQKPSRRQGEIQHTVDLAKLKEDSLNHIRTPLTDSMEALASRDSRLKIWGGYSAENDEEYNCLTERYWMKSNQILFRFGISETVISEISTLTHVTHFEEGEKPSFSCTTLFAQLEEKYIQLNCESLFYKYDNERYLYFSDILTDKSDNECSGIKIIKQDPEGNSRECIFDKDGNLLVIQAAEKPDSLTEPRVSLIKRFDTEGNIIEWKEWSYLPEDGLGWDWYLTEYDAQGNIIFEEYRGQA